METQHIAGMQVGTSEQSGKVRIKFLGLPGENGPELNMDRSLAEQLSAMLQTYLATDQDQDSDDKYRGEGKHKDDAGNDCDCRARECGYNVDQDPICPKCGASDESFDLVHGDHGNRCERCGATFTCP